MTENKHTPGPWDIQKLGNGLSVHSGKRHIARINENTFALPDEQIEADARLIAAAPELLEALEELMAEIKVTWCNKEWYWPKAKAAIAKAKGETK